MSPLLLRSGGRHLLRRPWQTVLAVLGIAVAVAVVVGIDLANGSSRRAFRLSLEGVAGRATHEIVGGPGGVDEVLYADLRAQGFRRLAPVVEGWVALPDRPDRALRLLGVDPFAEDLFRGFTDGLKIGKANDAERADLSAFLTLPGAVLLGSDLADELGLEPGDTWRVSSGGGEHELTLLTRLQPADPLARASSRDLLLVDLATAQEILGLEGSLSRIDAILDADAPNRDTPNRDEEARLAELLPPDVRLEPRGARAGTLDEMTRAFRLNLTALSLLALVVGLFLIYNTMTFSVVQRRTQIGTLRALGVTRREIFALVLGEAALVGAAGSALGAVLGVVLARGLIGLVSRTINDLYFAISVQGVDLAGLELAKGLLLGLVGTVLTAIPAAREATLAPPRATLQRSVLEGRVHRAAPRLALVGLGGMALAAALLALPTRSLGVAFAGVFLVLVGCAALVPWTTLVAMRLLEPLLRRAADLFGGGLLTSLAARGVAASLSRTGVAMAALVLAVAMTVGVSVMVRSFRATLVGWLDATLAADVYAAPIHMGRRGVSGTLEPGLVTKLAAAPGVGAVTTSRRVEVGSPDGPVQIQALGVEKRQHFGYPFARGTFRRNTEERAFASFLGGAVLVSEAFAFRRDLRVGDRLTLSTDHGAEDFEVAGVVDDFVSDRGVVFFQRAVYDLHWDDPEIQSLGLWAAPGVSTDALLASLRQAVRGETPITLEPNREIRRSALEIFDRTFVITGVLRILAMGVAFLGVLAALMAVQLERAREMAVLRASGMTPGQLWLLITGQTGIMGALAGVLALPVGAVLAALLIYVINRRSFGWTLQMVVEPSVLAQAMLLAILSALLAGIYPAWKMARTLPARALRDE